MTATVKASRRARHRMPDVKLKRPNRTSVVAATSIASLARANSVHTSATPLHSPTHHWDMLVQHVGKNAPLGPAGLTNWLDGLVNHHDTPQNGLLLIGPPKSGKTTFVQATKLLMPDNSVFEHRDYLLETAFVGVLDKALLFILDNGHQEPLGINPLQPRNGRYFKWIQCIATNPKTIPRHMTKIEVDALDACMPTDKFLRRLQDEREAFLHQLRSS